MITVSAPLILYAASALNIGSRKDIKVSNRSKTSNIQIRGLSWTDCIAPSQEWDRVPSERLGRQYGTLESSELS